MLRTMVWFWSGVAVILAAGWMGFPRVLYTTEAQPLEFRHRTHAVKSSVTECGDCHALREDGTFAGIPRNENCAACHAEPSGETKAELTLVNAYIKPGREIGWQVYSRQPANVRFSHAIHVKRGGLPCQECHGGHGESDMLRPYHQNRISGYSRDLWGSSISRLHRRPHEGMKMSDCEDCHRDRGVEAGCLGCHQ